MEFQTLIITGIPYPDTKCFGSIRVISISNNQSTRAWHIATSNEQHYGEQAHLPLLLY